MDPRERHWIDGRRAASASGATFDARVPSGPGGGGALVGRWPRAGAAELRAAREAAAAAEPAWRAMPAARRQACLTEALGSLRLEGAAAADLEALSGLSAARRRRGFEAALERLAGAPAGDLSSTLDVAPGPALVAPHWSEDLAGLLLDLLGPLAAGRSAIAAPDARLCALGDALLPFAEALPRGVVGVLHGLERGLAPAGAWNTGPAGRLRVRRGQDLAGIAARAVHAVYDAELGACGWRAHAPCVVLVDEAAHGAFVAALLEAFEAHPDRRAPCALAAAEARERSPGLLAAALEEGACVVPPRAGAFGRVLVNLAPDSTLVSAAAAGPFLRVVRLPAGL